jgi:short-subunit dehydrogenase
MSKLLTLIGGVVGGVAAWKLIAPEVKQRGPSAFLAGAHSGATAVVTGASSGIGEAFARRLAREGYNVVLVARRREKLDALAEDLKKRHAVNAQSVVADLSNEDDINRVADMLTEFSEAGKLDLLINNAGFGTTGNFINQPMKDQNAMINLHVTATMRLTRAALPGMIKQHRGAIINVASIAGWFPLPGNVNYSATKRYIITFSEALQTEMMDSGVFVQALCPGFTYSEFHDTAPYRNSGFRRDSTPPFMWQTADQVVMASLNSLGSGDATVIPGIHNRALTSLEGLVPRSAIRQARRQLGPVLGD